MLNAVRTLIRLVLLLAQLTVPISDVNVHRSITGRRLVDVFIEVQIHILMPFLQRAVTNVGGL